MFDVPTIISVIAGLLLSISESMPFIKNVESQGILHFLSIIGQKLLNNEPELQPLLDRIEPEIHTILNNEPKTVTPDIYGLIENININFDNKTNILNNEINIISGIIKNISNDFNNARQLKLQTSELYQLNYIINYIKQNYIKRQLQFRNLSKNNKELLISEGYTVNYDFKEDITVIGW